MNGFPHRSRTQRQAFIALGHAVLSKSESLYSFTNLYRGESSFCEQHVTELNVACNQLLCHMMTRIQYTFETTTNMIQCLGFMEIFPLECATFAPCGDASTLCYQHFHNIFEQTITDDNPMPHVDRCEKTLQQFFSEKAIFISTTLSKIMSKQVTTDIVVTIASENAKNNRSHEVIQIWLSRKQKFEKS